MNRSNRQTRLSGVPVSLPFPLPIAQMKKKKKCCRKYKKGKRCKKCPGGSD